ncbi:flagellar hook-length control protein FliK [Methylomonas sp. MgM2]
MNIQGTNLLSLLSGSENLGKLQQGLLGEGGEQTGFAAAFLQQLGLLQGSLAGDAANSGAGALSGLTAANGGESQLDLQSIADLLGKELPSATKAGQDIDLEETLQTLARVVQELQQLEAGDSEANPLPGSQVAGDDRNLGLFSDEERIESDAMVLGGAGGMPISVPQAEQSETSEASDDSAASTTDALTASKNTTALKLDAAKPDAQTETSVKLDDLGVDFNRSISAMLARQDSDGKTRQDKPNLNLKAESLLGGLDGRSDAEAGKSLPAVAADIAKLNQAMRGDAPAIPAQPLMTKHLNDPAWNNELSEKLIWMHKQAVPSAELRLNPEHLGPVLVKIDINHDQASVAFTTPHSAVKDAIEAAIPKLREMLGGQQLNLVDVNVSQQQSDQRQQARDFFQMASDFSRNQHGAGADGDTQLNEAQNLVDEIEEGRAVASNGLLSLFA